MGGMIALIPADPEQFTVPGGDPADEMHATLAYLGDDVESVISPEHQDAISQAVAEVAGLLTVQADGHVFAHAAFNPDDAEREPSAVYLVAGEFAPYVRAEVLDALRGITDYTLPEQHTPFVPHITAGYNIPVTELSYTGPVLFSAIRVTFDDDVTDYPLGGGGDMPPDTDEDNNVPKIEFAQVTGPETADGHSVPGETLVPTEVEQAAMVAVPEGAAALTLPVLVVEGMDTADGRHIEPGALSGRAVPFTLFAQLRNDGHDGADIVGAVTELTRVPGPTVTQRSTGQPFPEGTFIWQGKGWIYTDHEAYRMVRDGALVGNSADLSEVTAEYEYDGEDGTELLRRTVISKGVIAATTLIGQPAFPDAYATVEGAQLVVPEPVALTAGGTPSWRAGELGDKCTPCAAAEIAAAAGIPPERLVLTAAATVTAPPDSAFTDPQFDTITPITDDGRFVRGHIALWESCHTGYADRCMRPPRSRLGYAAYRTGVVVTASGVRIPVGHVTIGTGHADGSLRAAPAAAHYDNTGTVAADVVSGEDEFGIWVAGWLRDLTPAQLHEFRSAPMSGDWRDIGGALELVGVLGVNVPGFIVPRVTVHGGQPLSLIAASPRRPDAPDAAVSDAALTVAFETLATELRTVGTQVFTELAKAVMRS